MQSGAAVCVDRDCVTRDERSRRVLVVDDERPICLLCNLNHDVARALAADERTADLPIVFVSARASRDDVRAGLELGAVDYVTKPFDPEALTARVTEVLERAGQGEAGELRRERMNEVA